MAKKHPKSPVTPTEALDADASFVEEAVAAEADEPEADEPEALAPEPEALAPTALEPEAQPKPSAEERLAVFQDELRFASEQLLAMEALHAEELAVRGAAQSDLQSRHDSWKYAHEVTSEQCATATALNEKLTIEGEQLALDLEAAKARVWAVSEEIRNAHNAMLKESKVFMCLAVKPSMPAGYRVHVLARDIGEAMEKLKAAEIVGITGVSLAVETLVI